MLPSEQAVAPPIEQPQPETVASKEIHTADVQTEVAPKRKPWWHSLPRPGDLVAGASGLKNRLTPALNGRIARVWKHPFVMHVRRRYGYPVKSLALLMALNMTMGHFENIPLGMSGMWVNMLTVSSLIGALMVFLYVRRNAHSSSEALTAAAILVLWWESMFVVITVLVGMVAVPGALGPRGTVLLFQQQSPYIWWIFVTPLISGVIGCAVFLYSSQSGRVRS